MKKHRKYKDFHRVIDGIEQKQCEMCNNWFDMNETNFKIRIRNKDGFNHKCNACQKKYNDEYYVKTRERQIELAKIRMYANYEKHKQSLIKNNARPEVKLAIREASRKQRLRGDQKKYIQEHPEKTKIYSQNHRIHDITTSEWENCLKVFNNSCAYCGISNEEQYKHSKQNLHKEHVEEDGYNDLRNAVPACRSCNDRKWLFDIEEWYRQQPFFSENKLNKIKWWCSEGYKDYIEDKPPYKYFRSRIYRENGTWYYIHELWSMDEKRNKIECIATGMSKKEVMEKI